MLLEAAVNFPKDDSNDIIDSMTQALIKLKSSGWVYNKQDPRPIEEDAWKKEYRPYT
jgi:hypothetical protein